MGLGLIITASIIAICSVVLLLVTIGDIRRAEEKEEQYNKESELDKDV